MTCSENKASFFGGDALNPDGSSKFDINGNMVQCYCFTYIPIRVHLFLVRTNNLVVGRTRLITKCEEGQDFYVEEAKCAA